jgi:hypothetical protein
MDPDKVVFRGKVTGGASFEAVAEFSSNEISLGGRVLDPGELKNPLRFAIRTQFREFYKNVDLTDRDEQRKYGDDELRLETLDGDRERIEMLEVVEAGKLCGEKGAESIRMEAKAYDGRRFEFTASENSAMWIEERSGKPLAEGFTIHWRADPAKDKEGRARLVIEIK